jgi:hypothetical protein
MVTYAIMSASDKIMPEEMPANMMCANTVNTVFHNRLAAIKGKEESNNGI